MIKAIVGSAIVVVLCALAGGFYLIGPPAEARARRLDARRETDLQQLRQAIDLYWTRNRRLPDSLDQLAREAGSNTAWRDPDTAGDYGYAVKAADTFELCAVFTRASDSGHGFWSHGTGRRCFDIAATPVRP